MSSCLILQGDNKLYIGADTSSSTFANGKLYRLDNKTKKIFKLNDNSILYCAGNNYISNIVKNYIISVYNTKNFSFISLQKWLSDNFPLRKNDEYTVYDVEILIATIKLDKTIIYQMSQYNNFVLAIHEAPKRGIKILSAGIKNQDCVSFAESEMLQKKDVKSIYYNTFSNLSCNYIGGNLDLYALSKDGVDTIFNNQRINEFGIQYIYNSIKNKSVSINAEVLISKLVMSENLWIENDSCTYKFNDSGFIASSGKNSVKIQPNNASELFSIYKDNQKQVYINSDGDVEFAGILKSSSGVFGGLISGGSINLGNGTFTVDENGNMYASSARISGEVNASSGTIGGWNIGTNSLYRNYVSTTIGYINTTLSPAGLTFDVLNQNDTQSDTMIINPLNIGWDTGDGEIRSLMSRTSITTPELSTNELKFVRTSNPKIICQSGTLTFDTTNNVHFYNTPYIDVHQSYLAREEWCNDRFALKSSLSSYLTSSSLNGYTTNTHLEARLDDIKAWVRNNFKRK